MFNLENVDSPEAWDCPLVLTSPRSLAACRLVGVKPVELLANDLTKLADLRDLLEHRRLTKLEHCRAIRQYLISQNAIDEQHLLSSELEEEDPSSPDNIYRSNVHVNTPNWCAVAVPFRHRNRNCFSRKKKLDMENRAVAEELKTLSTKNGESLVRPCPRGFQTSSLRASASPCPLHVRPVFADGFGRTNFSQSCFENEANLPKRSQLRRQNRYKRSETPFSDKMTSSETEPKADQSIKTFDEISNLLDRPQSANVSEFERTATPHGSVGAHGHRRKPCKMPQRRPPPLLPYQANLSPAGLRERSSKCISQQIRIETPQYFACRNKIATLGTHWRRTAEAVGLSEEDQRILRLMERKALEKKCSEITADAARILWEREGEQRTKQQEWEKERRKLEITERRKKDEAETKSRLSYLETNFNRAQRRLADTLRRRDAQAQQRLAKIALQKDAIRAEKKAANLAKQASVEKRLRHLNQEFRRQQSFQAEELEVRMRNAEGRREWCSSSTIERRQMNSASVLGLPTTGTGTREQCCPRKRPSSAPRPTSATLDPRILSARIVRDALERNLHANRVRHVVQSEAAGRAAASRACARIRARSTRVRITRTRRRVAHLASAAKLTALRGASVAKLKSRIRAGERKIAALLAAKESSVASSRATAVVAAQLRQNLRGTLSPTFDRMALDVQHALRIPSSSRRWTADHHSVTHIKLG